MEVNIAGTLLKLLQGNIVEQDVEAIVNAANTGLWGGSGVDGAIHSAGGPAIAAECRRIREEQGGCPVGRAVITSGGFLKARYVIHTVGPIWHGGRQGEDELLASAYRSSLQLAKDRGIKSLAFPSISTGAYRFPVERAAGIAMATTKDFLAAHPAAFKEVRFVLFTPAVLAAFEQALGKVLESAPAS
ncbi:O-acetyl-ADP-ribose deacetylase [Moorella sulfitireducens (nom. illeg.)]|uniref:O-acetyl-ADP-ribose deacetylase n=1 Tax=Neomoorella sulfitireducens TaxID=2972948 RepID=UPI0021ABEAD7|nr:O-acetyl-ADP-ribose deacetylase [Moorella sulfitireducens]